MSALLDTGFVLALLAPNDRVHEKCVATMANEVEPLLPTPVLPELAYLTIRDLGYEKFLSFYRFALAGNPRLISPTDEDFWFFGISRG